jgi:hypothetical protein
MLAAGCSSSSKSSTPTTAAPTTVVATTTSGGSATTGGSTPGGGQSITITPSSGLAATAKVMVDAKGFSPNEALVVTQCASKGNNTTEGDCNLNDQQFVTSSSSGTVSVQFTVVKGPFGSNKIVCSASQACLVSVSQASLSPTQEADSPITFS